MLDFNNKWCVSEYQHRSCGTLMLTNGGTALLSGEGGEELLFVNKDQVPDIKKARLAYDDEFKWVKCDHAGCDRWRCVHKSAADDDAEWFCEMNPNKELADCAAPQEPEDAATPPPPADWLAQWRGRNRLVGRGRSGRAHIAPAVGAPAAAGEEATAAPAPKRKRKDPRRPPPAHEEP